MVVYSYSHVIDTLLDGDYNWVTCIKHGERLSVGIHKLFVIKYRWE